MSLYCLALSFLFLMLRRPPRSTRTDTSCPTRRSSDLIDNRLAALREPPGRLQQQGRFADPRIAADQRRRSGDETAAHRTIEFGDPAQHPFGHDVVSIERFERQSPPAARQVVLRRKDGFEERKSVGEGKRVSGR